MARPVIPRIGRPAESSRDHVGIGAAIDLPSMSVLVRGLDAGPERADASEPRLLAAVRWVLGPRSGRMRRAPWDPRPDDAYTRVGVPVTPFPRWVRCPRCHRLGPLDPPGQFSLCTGTAAARPGQVVHAWCRARRQTRLANRRACVPGALPGRLRRRAPGRFPYVEYVHMTRPRASATARS